MISGVLEFGILNRKNNARENNARVCAPIVLPAFPFICQRTAANQASLLEFNRPRMTVVYGRT
jgi:hypothetical protein